MSWRELVQETSARLVIPWLGGRRIYRGGRTWRIDKALPREFGWYLFELAGRRAELVEEAQPDPDYGDGWKRETGYLIGNRIIPWESAVPLVPDNLLLNSAAVYLVEPGLDRFTLASVVVDPEGRFIYSQELFPQGPEDRVREAFIARKESINDIPGVSPSLDFAFRFASHQRQLLEERRAELERIQEEERRREEAMRNMGTGLGRRTLAATDFDTGARAALAVSGAELLDTRQGRGRREMVVQYRVDHRRLECVVDKNTLRVIDSGICLTDHHTGEKGDTYFTLESLPNVIRQAVREDKLVVYRHVDDDWDEED